MTEPQPAAASVRYAWRHWAAGMLLGIIPAALLLGFGAHVAPVADLSGIGVGLVVACACVVAAYAGPLVRQRGPADVAALPAVDTQIAPFAATGVAVMLAAPLLAQSGSLPDGSPAAAGFAAAGIAAAVLLVLPVPCRGAIAFAARHILPVR